MIQRLGAKKQVPYITLHFPDNDIYTDMTLQLGAQRVLAGWQRMPTPDPTSIFLEIRVALL